MRRDRLSALRCILIGGALVGALLTGGGILATDPHSGSTTGQPNQSCQSFVPPGAPLNVPGFNTTGFNDVATAQYAGSQPQNSNNPNSVSQYDVACFQQSTR
jgi:hypothetical protein